MHDFVENPRQEPGRWWDTLGGYRKPVGNPCEACENHEKNDEKVTGHMPREGIGVCEPGFSLFPQSPPPCLPKS